MKVQIEIPPKLIPVFSGNYRYCGSYGGRGSAKTRTFAKMTAVIAYMRTKEQWLAIVELSYVVVNL